MASTGQSLRVSASKKQRTKLKLITNQGTSLQCGVFSVTTENIENYEDFVVTDLKLTHTGTGEER